MFGRISTTKSTGSCSDNTEKLKKALNEADAVVIGAGAGLSTSAGFVYNGEQFEKYFSDFGRKYGFKDMYSGGFYPYETPEEMWAYWSRNIWINRYIPIPNDTYDRLYDLVKDKDYFWIQKGEDGKAVVAFTRTSDDQNLLAILNFSGEEACFNKRLSGEVSFVFDTYDRKTSECSEDIIYLSPFEGLLVELK